MLGFNHLGRMRQLVNQMFQYASLKGIARNRGFDYMVANHEDTVVDSLGNRLRCELFNPFDVIVSKFSPFLIIKYADIWFSMDYYINYEPIFRIKSKEALIKKELILEDITNRITRSNPLGLFFLAEVQKKLGKIQEAKKNKILVKDLRSNSEFWDVRMRAFSL